MSGGAIMYTRPAIRGKCQFREGVRQWQQNCPAHVANGCYCKHANCQNYTSGHSNTSNTVVSNLRNCRSKQSASNT
jgi:hypothetical protein